MTPSEHNRVSHGASPEAAARRYTPQGQRLLVGMVQRGKWCRHITNDHVHKLAKANPSHHRKKASGAARPGYTRYAYYRFYAGELVEKRTDLAEAEVIPLMESIAPLEEWSSV